MTLEDLQYKEASLNNLIRLLMKELAETEMELEQAMKVEVEKLQ